MLQQSNCIILALLVAATVATSFDGIFYFGNRRSCDSLGVLIYEDMNCTLQSRQIRTGCPDKYTCDNLEKRNNTCYFKGDTYQSGENVNNSRAFCSTGCECQNIDHEMNFTCTTTVCNDTSLDPPCYRTYDLDHCCSTGENCPIDPPYRCFYKGRIYKEGERFFPRDTCSMCVCQRGFRGVIEPPFCSRRRCDVELKALDKIQNECAPLYENRQDLWNNILCCPSSYVCSDGNETVIGRPVSDEECRFGNITLKVGQEVRKTILGNGGDPGNVNVRCNCYVPPLLTCRRTRRWFY